MPFLIFALLMWLILKCTGLFFGVIGYILLAAIGIIGFGVSLLAGAVVVIAGILALFFMFLR